MKAGLIQQLYCGKTSRHLKYKIYNKKQCFTTYFWLNSQEGKYSIITTFIEGNNRVTIQNEKDQSVR